MCHASGASEMTRHTRSNSSSLSSYSIFSSSSSKPGANAAQLSGELICHRWISPEVATDAMTGRVGCHCLNQHSVRSTSTVEPSLASQP